MSEETKATVIEADTDNIVPDEFFQDDTAEVQDEVLEAQPAEDTPAEAVETEEAVVEEGIAESTEEGIAESTLEKLMSDGQDTKEVGKQTVPLSDHIKLRQRAQAAEAKAKEIEEKLAEQTTQPTAENVETMLGKYQDDEFVDITGKDLKDLSLSIKEQTKKEILGTLKEAQVEESRKSMVTRAIQSEKVFKQTHTDFDDVISSANALRLIDPEAESKIFASTNPAKAYYDYATAQINQYRHTQSKVLGIELPSSSKKPVATQTKTKSEDTKVPEDDDVFEEVFGSSE